MRDDFGARLQREFQHRRQTNPRYSLRAFALFLGTHHSTLSQILRGSRQVPARHLRRWASKIGLSAEEIAVYSAAQQLPSALQAKREERMRQWTAESLSVMSGNSHWRIVRLCHCPEFRPDSNWVADQVGLSVDEVNIAFTQLVRLRILDTRADGSWADRTNSVGATAEEFRALALRRIREELWLIR